MSEAWKGIIGVAILLGILALITFAATGLEIRHQREQRERFEREAIQHGAGTYDRTTGKFIWKDGGE